MVEEIRELSGAYYVSRLEEGQGDATQARSSITHRVGTCANGTNAWAWNPLQAKLEDLAGSTQCEGYGRVSNPQQRQVTWLEAIAEWQKYGVIEYLKEKKPSLCNTCAIGDDPSKETTLRFAQNGSTGPRWVSMRRLCTPEHVRSGLRIKRCVYAVPRRPMCSHPNHQRSPSRHETDAQWLLTAASGVRHQPRL